MKVKQLLIKNVAKDRQRRFFKPLNRWVHWKANIDILKLAEGDSKLAQVLAAPYRSHKDWQVFELLHELPSPEGQLKNETALGKPDAPVAEEKAPAEKPKSQKVVAPKKVESEGTPA